MQWYFIGDSHIDAIRRAAEQGLLNRPAAFKSVGGATAVGLRNPNSFSDALSRFRAEILPVRSDSIPVIQLGEVDCGFVIWYRAAKYGESIEQQMNDSLAAYFAFVDELRHHGYAQLVVTAPVLPTIRDGQDWGEVANARREVTATLKQRTDLTLRYIDGLKAGAQDRGLPFIDLTPDLLDKATGVLADAFRHPNPADHHLHPEKAAALWSDHLNRLP